MAYVYIDTKTLELLRNVAEDTRGLVECNCSYDSKTAPENRCDGSCTYSMAVEALRQLKTAHGPDCSCNECISGVIASAKAVMAAARKVFGS